MNEPGSPNRRYASDRMGRRQEEILAAAREMLTEGDGTIRMRELAERSGVALGTIYNRFGSKERVALEAVIDVFRNRVVPWEQTANEDVIDRMMERIASAVAEIRRRPPFARTMAACYFGAASDENAGLAEALHDYPASELRKGLLELHELGALRGDTDIAELADEITRAQYAAVAHWAKGLVSEEALERSMQRALLQHLFVWLEGSWAEKLQLRPRLR
ncbi:MAG: TetR/AcrR family transcriptional regulator [Erythrobacter sp.]|jgi:AcrR family transcriptional regulator|uniref:TetR/AcrR family transcriptional regulator n=1 Tax=Erythrobacter sp. TaxID=1042 RepID=UPI002B466C7C|nr:TetR/AcrR family transcriptional regulator [Erythrobacter sp.]WRH69400.1 MAG: TetR/AcrR family transcriptional regulator [Erythrobacter sp.]